MDVGIMNGTNQVLPMNGGYGYEMNGTNQVMPLNGTNQVMPLQGTSQVVPMQGVGGGFYEVEIDPLALLDENDVPMNGIPDDYDDDDVEMYRMAYLVGDPDALQGLFKNLKAKIQQARAGNKAARTERREERQERQDLRMQNKRTRAEKRASGQGFFDKVGGFLGNLGEAKRIASEAAAALDNSGVEFDDDVLEQRAALAADAGASGGDVRMSRSSEGGAGSGFNLQNWWASRSTMQKGLVVAGGAFGLYAGYKLFTGQPIFGGKKRGGKK